MHVLITGGSGFLGSSLARHLATAGHRVSVVLRAASSLARLEPAVAGVDIVRIAMPADLFPLLADLRPDAVIHTACNYGRHGERLYEIASANTTFGIAVLQAAADAGVAVFINTDTVLDRLTSPYALSKKQFAEWGEWFGRLQKIRCGGQHPTCSN